MTEEKVQARIEAEWPEGGIAAVKDIRGDLNSLLLLLMATASYCIERDDLTPKDAGRAAGNLALNIMNGYTENVARAHGIKKETAERQFLMGLMGYLDGTLRDGYGI